MDVVAAIAVGALEVVLGALIVAFAMTVVAIYFALSGRPTDDPDKHARAMITASLVIAAVSLGVAALVGVLMVNVD